MGTPGVGTPIGGIGTPVGGGGVHTLLGGFELDPGLQTPSIFDKSLK